METTTQNPFPLPGIQVPITQTSTPAAILLPAAPHGPLTTGGGAGGGGSSSWGGTAPAPSVATPAVAVPPAASTTVAPLTTGATAPVVQSVPQGARLLGPTEFASIALQNKVGPSNESKYFFREKGTDKIYLKADAPLGGTSLTTPQKDTNISIADTGSPIPVSGTGGSATAAVGAAAGNSKLNDLAVQGAKLEQQQKDNAAASNKRFDDLITSATNGINEMTSVSYSKVLSDLQQQEDLKGKEAALDAIKGQIGDINTGLQQALLHAADQPIPLSFIRGQQAKIQMQAAAVVTALAAKADIIQGQLDRANTRITQFYNAKKEDISTQNDRVKMLLDLQEKGIVHLDDNEKEALKFQVDNFNSLRDSIDKEHQQVIQLATQYPDAFAKANVDFNMPLDEILQKVGAAKGTLNIEKEDRDIVSSLAVKYGDAGILPGDSIEVATAKLKKSAIYKDAIRPPASSGGGGGGGLSGYDSMLATLIGSAGSDGHANTDVYKRLRSSLSKSTDQTAFDKNFAYLLNPVDPTAKAFIASTPTGASAPKYTSKTLPPDLTNSFFGDASDPRATLEKLISVYPEIDPAYVTQVYNQSH